MKAELSFPPELVDAIADKVIERLKPLVIGNGKHDSEDIVFDKKGLSNYLKLYESTINKMVSNKQIPHFKIQPGQSGGVRFYKRHINKWIDKQSIPEINQFKGRR
jgi:hypothetical protein